MTKAEQDKFKKWLHDKAIWILESMAVDFIDLEIFMADRNQRDGSSTADYLFTAKYHRQYRQLQIAVYPVVLEKYKNDKELLVKSLIHELSHIHTIPIGNMALQRCITEEQIREEVESLTETIAHYVRQNIENIKGRDKLYQ